MNVINEGEFTIIEDVLPKESIEGFENIVIPHLNYSMGENYQGTSGISNDFFNKHGIKNIYEQFQFYNLVFSNRERDFQKEHYHLLTLPLTLACLSIGLCYTFDHLIRIKANIQTKAPKEFEGRYNKPHIDLSPDELSVYQDTFTAIYYVNDSDGDTFFFEGQESGFTTMLGDKENIQKYNNLTIKKIVSPKQNKMVIFPAKTLHSGSHPINSTLRSVINYNFSAVNIRNTNSRV